MKHYIKYLKYAIPHIRNVRKACWAMSEELAAKQIILCDDKVRRLIMVDAFGGTKWRFEYLDVTPSQIWWQGVLHDLSRFRLSELVGYANSHGAGTVKRDANGQYSGLAISDDPIELAREKAMINHWRRNKHHWEHWNRNRGPKELLNIPDRYLLEMACDQWGASVTQGHGGRIWSRYQRVKDSMMMSDENHRTFDFCLLWVEVVMNGSVYSEG